jgi:Flp pilus assembly protein TadD
MMPMESRTGMPSFCAALSLLAGCTTLAPSDEAAQVTADMLLSEVAQAAMPSPYYDTHVLALDDAMHALLAEYVDPSASDQIRLNQLIHALIGEAQYQLNYGPQTRTAIETFHRREGNCLSFTIMFVAFARHAGLAVSFQEVDVPPDWTVNDGTFLLNRHVNARISLGIGGEHIVDFNIEDFRSTYDQRRISDERALAHFYNNKGVELMQVDDHAGAMIALRIALQRDPTFAPAWNNLGTLYRRQSRLGFAEASYLQALEMNRNEYVAMSNLASLYTETGDKPKVKHFADRTNRHRKNNPYYRFKLAREAFGQRHYDTAIENLEFAIRAKEWEDSFYFLLGLSYLQKGDQARARKWLTKAEEVAANDALKRNYQSKIDLLLSPQ